MYLYILYSCSLCDAAIHVSTSCTWLVRASLGQKPTAAAINTTFDIIISMCRYGGLQRPRLVPAYMYITKEAQVMDQYMYAT